MKFSDLKPGDVFRWHNDVEPLVCVRIADPQAPFNNAAIVGVGELSWFAADDEVQPLDVHFTERGEG